MDLNSHLERLRSKPEHIRQRYAFWTALGLTLVIFAFWISSFSVGSSKAPNAAAVATAVQKTSTPAQSMIAGVGALFTDLKDVVFGPKKVTYSSIEVRAGRE